MSARSPWTHRKPTTVSRGAEVLGGSARYLDTTRGSDGRGPQKASRAASAEISASSRKHCSLDDTRPDVAGGDWRLELHGGLNHLF
jgi:hypothetical protein